MNDSSKTKLTIDDLVEAQRETSNSLKIIAEHLDTMARHERRPASDNLTHLIFLAICVLLGFLEFGQIFNANMGRDSESKTYVPLLVPFVIVFVGYQAVRYFNSESAYLQKRYRVALLEEEKKAAADQTPPTSSW